MKRAAWLSVAAMIALAWGSMTPLAGQGSSVGNRKDGKHLFEQETFGGNGRTCLTCHGSDTGTVSPPDAQRRFAENPGDPLFLHDGSDDGFGNGVSRMLADATILMTIPLPDNVIMDGDPSLRSVVLRRGIPTTLNTPGLDPVLMLDGRQPNLLAQAAGAIADHAQATSVPDDADLQRIADFQTTDAFFSSPALSRFFTSGRIPQLPEGRTASEKRGRLFFEDVPHSGSEKAGLCAECHTGRMLNATSRFHPFFPVLPEGSRFQGVLVSEFNAAGNPLHTFVFHNPNGSTSTVVSPDPGRALITGDAHDFPNDFPFDSVNAFKIPSLWGIRRTAPYFHDNSAKTLEDVAAHYAQFFELVSGGGLILTPQDQADMVAFMNLLR